MKSCPECYSEYEDAVELCPSDQTPLRAIEKDPLIGSKLADRYEVVSVLGRGGMGVVYKVRHETMDRFMAVKMLHSHLVSEAEAVMRFHREAKTVSQVRHHHIITLYDFGMSAQRQPYLVMDYLEGTSLKTILKDFGGLPFERTAHIYAQVVEALQTAHGMDLVHRDLKPENIMLSNNHGEEDWVTLVDFGLSKLKEAKVEEGYHITKVGDVCGSPPYMSPEQCLSSQVVDPRSDIYSLAICIYETLTCKLPFNARSAIEMLDAHLYATPIPFNQALPELKVCTELTHVLNKALQKDPDKRHQTIQEFGQELAEAMRRDGLKLRTFKQRLEISSYSDLLSEAEALQKEEQEKQTASVVGLDGFQFVTNKEDHKNGGTETGTALNAVSSLTCPYCAAPLQPGIRFCINCQHNLPGGPAGANAQQHAAQSATRGFTSRAKTKTSQSNMPVPPQILAAIVVLIIAGGLFAWTVPSVKKSVTQLFSPGHTETAQAPDTAPEKKTAPTKSTEKKSSERKGAGRSGRRGH